MTTQTPQSLRTTEADGDPTLSSSAGGTSARDRAAQVGGTAKDQAASVAEEAKYQARDLVGEARTQVRQQVDTQKGRLSDLLREIGEELEQMADGSDRNGVGADLARQVASRARDVRGYLDGDGDLLSDVRRFARRRPAAFLLGAAAAGILAGRATRAAGAARKQQSTARDTGSSRWSQGDTWTTTGTGTSAPPAPAGYATGGPTSGYATTAGYATPEPTGSFVEQTVSAQPAYAQPGYAAQPEYAAQRPEFAAEQGATYPEVAGYPAADYPAADYPVTTPPAATGYVAPDDTDTADGPGTLPPDREEHR